MRIPCRVVPLKLLHGHLFHGLLVDGGTRRGRNARINLKGDRMQTYSKCGSANLVLGMLATHIYMQEPTGELDDNGYTHVAENAEWYM